MEQVTGAVKAVFASWHSDRAEVYRRREGIPVDLATAATVQAMVFGNRGDESGTGVVFTRDPSSGASGLVGDFLARAQGEDVVAGTHQTMPIAEMERLWPDVAADLHRVAGCWSTSWPTWSTSSSRWRTAGCGCCRAGWASARPGPPCGWRWPWPRTRRFRSIGPRRCARVADLLDAPPTEAERAAGGRCRGAGPGSGGVARPGRGRGEPRRRRRGEPGHHGQDVILVRPETSPADVHGMAEARGLVTRYGGLMSHAAVVARSWGLPAVVGGGRSGADGRQPSRPEATGWRRARRSRSTATGAWCCSAPIRARGARCPRSASCASGRPSWPRRSAGGGAEPVADGPTTGSGGGPRHGYRRRGRPGRGADRRPCRRLLVLKGMATAEVLAGLARVEAAAMASVAGGPGGPGPRPARPRGSGAAHGRRHGGGRSRLRRRGDGGRALHRTPPRPVPHLNHRFKQVVTDWQMRTVDGSRSSTTTPIRTTTPGCWPPCPTRSTPGSAR